MVLVSDFNKELVCLFKSKFPTEKNKLLDFNLTSESKNPSSNYNVSLKEGNILTVDGNSTLKWNAFSTQIETKMDMNGLSILEAKTVPYSGFSLTAKFERSSRGQHNNGNSNNGNTGGTLEIGGDIQKENIQTRLRISPTIETIGCVNKLSKERESTGMMLSNTFTRPMNLLFPSDLSIGMMISSPNINKPPSYNYNKNSLKMVMGLMLKGPIKRLCGRNGGFRSRWEERERFLGFGSGSTSNEALSRVESPNYVMSIQTNTNNQNRLSGFTGGLYLNNLLKNTLTLGLMVVYNYTKNDGRSGEGGGSIFSGMDFSENNNSSGSPTALEVENSSSHLSPTSKTATAAFASSSSSVSTTSMPNNASPITASRHSLVGFSDKIHYTLGGKVSFGSMRSQKGEDREEFGNGGFCGEKREDLKIEKSTDLRFRFSSDFKVAYSLTHRFTKNISATFGTQIDIEKLKSNPDSIKYGFLMDMSV
ncbi:hypothetical protein HWI79_1020 [Cryptosporidium felis]|nr:hypothetical protein HWI79_1020 [Cryptosporidium felis]